MSYSPATADFSPLIIDPYSRYSIGSEMARTSPPASAAWPTANRAIFIPFYLPRLATVVKGWLWNGATVSGNFEIAVYDFIGPTRRGTTGTQAQAGINITQAATLAATLPPGIYYMACIVDNTTAAVFRSQNGSGIQNSTSGMAIWDTTIAMGVTATLASYSAVSSFVPMFGLSFRTLTS